MYILLMGMQKVCFFDGIILWIAEFLKKITIEKVFRVGVLWQSLDCWKQNYFLFKRIVQFG